METNEKTEVKKEGYQFFDEKLLPEAFGLINTGASCWFNSMLQSFLACTAFNEFLLNNIGVMKHRSNTAREYIRLIYSLHTGHYNSTAIGNASIVILDAFRQDLQQKKVALDVDSQESVANGIGIFIDMFDSQELYKVFDNKYTYVNECQFCGDKKTMSEQKNPVLNLHWDGSITNKEDFFSMMMKRIVINEDFTCEKCKKKGNAVITESLCMLREVIIINLMRIPPVSPVYFPQTISFPTGGNKELKYKLISQMDYYGHLNTTTYSSSGHWMARSIRSGGVFKLNDTSVSVSQLVPIPNANVIMYHLLEKCDR